MNVAYNALLLDRGEYSGVHVAIRELLAALARTRAVGDRLTVYARPGAEGLPPETPDGVRIVQPRLPMRWRTLRIFWEQFRLPYRVFDDRADLLHGPGYLVPRLCLLPMVATVHDLIALVAPQYCTAANRSHFRRLLPATLAKAARIVVPARAVANDIERWALRHAAEHRHWPFDPDGLARRLRVIPWGVAERWRPATRRERGKTGETTKRPERFFLVVARPEPKKNLALALRAFFAAAMARNLPHRLVFIGPAGWGKDRDLRAEASRLGIGDRVLFPGFVAEDELREWYSAADALLMPSWTEGFGLPALEAMACGCPLVAAKIPALLEVAGEDNACFARPDDLPAWRAALESLAADAGRRRHLSEAGQARARLFSWDAAARSYWEVDGEVLKESVATKGKS